MRRPATLIGTALIGLAATAPAGTAATTLFPVVGGARYTNDYGDARAQGSHEGNDLMAPKGTPVIAVVDGVVDLHRSGRGGYMLYLRGSSREYVYIHLNNDRRGDDGKGGRRTAYAKGLKDGMRVRAGQEIAYVGDSGDAEGAPPHLHFEDRTLGGRPRNPYSRLRRASVVLFGAPLDKAKAATTALTLRGRLVSVATDESGGRAAIRLRSVVVGGRRVVTRRLVVVRLTPDLAAAAAALAVGRAVDVSTEPAKVTLDLQLMRPGTLQAASLTAR
jgi:Peptidase family M23